MHPRATNNLSREIRALAFPAIISNITTPLLGLVDTAIVGHIGAAYLGAIAVGGTIFSMLYWLLNFLRMGTGGLTAQAYGAGNHEQTSRVLHRALLVALAAGVILIAASHPLASALIGFMDTDPTTAALARHYFLICIWGAPAAIGTYALAGWFVGMQDSRSPMWMSLLTNVVNIAVSLVLVVGLHLRIEGVAAGTITAQWAGFALGIAIVVRRYKPLNVSLRQMLRRRPLIQFFKINTDIFLRTLCLVAVTTWFTHAGAQAGTVTLAANALLMQFFLLFSYFIDGYAYAAEAMAGRYAGQGQFGLVRPLVRRLMAIGLMLALLCSVVYFVGGTAAIDLLTDDPAVRLAARDYRLWAVVVPLVGFPAFVYDGIYVGLTITRRMVLAMIAAVVVFFATYLLLTPSLGNHALWLAFALYLLTRSLMQTILLKTT